MFSFYGAKHRTAKLYPAPLHGTIVEPFAGSAAYASAYPERDIVLVERDPIVAGLWRWLIAASADEIRSLPLLDHGTRVRDLGVRIEAQWLIGFWCNHGTTAPRQTLTAFSHRRPSSFWGPEIRERVASQVDRIRHWQVIEGDYAEAPEGTATHFIDPPYVGAGRCYRHGSGAIDYTALGAWCRSRSGQVIACENVGASWLPFGEFLSAKSSRGVSREAVWVSGCSRCGASTDDTCGLGMPDDCERAA
jgi:hypothetical protein